MTAQVKLQTNNVDEVLKAMTLEEKAMLVVGGNRQIATSGENNGMIGGHAQRVPGAAGATQSIPRLGIPSTVLTDGPAGVRISPRRDNDTNTYFCTGFPVGTALACTWNTQLVEEVGTSKKSVSYPFGFVLSYTTFTYSKPVVKATKDGLTASITATNTGKRAGKEVVELYVSAPAGGLEKPACELKAFAKTRELQPNQSETLTMKLSLYDLASYNEATQAWEQSHANGRT